MQENIRVSREVLKGVQTVMALIDDLNAAIDKEDQDVIDAANRVIATINSNSDALAAAQAQIADLQAQLEAALAAGAATPEQLQTALDKVIAASTALEAVDTAPVAPITP